MSIIDIAYARICIMTAAAIALIDHRYVIAIKFRTWVISSTGPLASTDVAAETPG